MGIRAPNLVKVVWHTREQQIKAAKWPLDWEMTMSFKRYLPEDSVAYCDMCGDPLCEECGNLGLCSTNTGLCQAETSRVRAVRVGT